MLFFYTGILPWNNLPLNIKMAETKRDFKHKVRVYLWNKVDHVKIESRLGSWAMYCFVAHAVLSGIF